MSKNNHIKWGAIVLLAVILTGCEEPVDLDIGVEKQLVVNCQFSPEAPFQAWVSTTKDPLSNEYADYLRTAQVRIFQDEELLCELLPVKQDEYPFDVYVSMGCLPQPEGTYTIEVSEPNYTAIRATDAVPPVTDIHSLSLSDLEEELISDTVVYFHFDLSLELEEVEEVPVYYYLNFNYEWIPYEVVGPDTNALRTGEFTALELVGLPGNPDYTEHFDERERGILFRRETTGPLTLTFRASTPNPVFLKMDLFDKVFANLRTVSEDYYWYHLQLSRQADHPDSIFYEPVILADNVENGYGLFGGFALSRDSVMVEFE